MRCPCCGSDNTEFISGVNTATFTRAEYRCLCCKDKYKLSSTGARETTENKKLCARKLNMKTKGIQALLACMMGYGLGTLNTAIGIGDKIPKGTSQLYTGVGALILLITTIMYIKVK